MAGVPKWSDAIVGHLVVIIAHANLKLILLATADKPKMACRAWGMYVELESAIYVTFNQLLSIFGHA